MRMRRRSGPCPLCLRLRALLGHARGRSVDVPKAPTLAEPAAEQIVNSEPPAEGEAEGQS